MKLIALFSGGKDSTYAIHWAYLQGFRIEVLVTFVPKKPESWLLHRPFAEFTALQAEAMGLNHRLYYVSGDRDREDEEILTYLRDVVREFNAYGIIIGALLSDYQRMRFARIAMELGLKIYSPLWRIDQARYMLEIVRHGIKPMIVSITAYGIPLDFLGKVIDENLVHRILHLAKKYRFNPAFEGGEAETFVIDAPLFKYRLCVDGEKKVVSSYEGYIVPKEVYLC